MVTLDAAEHYPAAALAARQEGDVQMSLTVDPLGKVTGCTVVDGSMVKALDDTACALMKSNGKFDPALDSNGKPVKSVVPVTFNWVLPRPSGEKGAPASALPASVRIGADGQVADCQYKSEGIGNRMPNPCDTVGGKLRYIPFSDAAGRPVGKRITFRTEVTVEDEAALKQVPGK